MGRLPYWFCKMSTQKKVWVLAICSFLAIIAISFMKSALELEDAEQGYYSQWWRWGYDDQPPLYTWLQKMVNYLFGVNKFSLSFLRGLVFASTILVGYEFFKQILKDKNKALFSVLLWVFVPVFIDWTFRRLSHTSLLSFSVLLTYWLFFLIKEKQTLIRYILFGLAISIGLLTKYNFVLVLIPLFIFSCIQKDYRSLLLNFKILISVSIALLCIVPHFLWVLGYKTELTESIHLKTAAKSGWPIISPILSYVMALLKMIWPLILFSVFLFYKGYYKPNVLKIKKNPLLILFWIQLSILIIVFIAADVQKVETRWLFPLFIPFFGMYLWFFPLKNLSFYVNKGFVIFLAVIAIQFLRTPIEKVIGIKSAVHYGFTPLLKKLNKGYKNYHWQMQDVTYGGNIHLLEPNRQISTLDDYSLDQSKLPDTKRVKVVTKYSYSPEMGQPTDSLLHFGRYNETLFFITVK